MTAHEMQEMINMRVYLPVDGGLLVECVVSNVKVSYGKLRVRVMPISGQGETWVDAARVRPLAGQTKSALDGRR